MENVNITHAIDDEVLFVSNLRNAADLPMLRASYNTFVHCRGGRILVEVESDARTTSADTCRETGRTDAGEY